MACFHFDFIGVGSYKTGASHLLLGYNWELDQRIGLCQENTGSELSDVHLERSTSEKLKLGLKQSSGRGDCEAAKTHWGEVGMAGSEQVWNLTGRKSGGERTRTQGNERARQISLRSLSLHQDPDRDNYKVSNVKSDIHRF